MSFQWCSKLFPYCCWYFLIVVISYCHLLQHVDICCFVLILLVICWFCLYLLVSVAIYVKSYKFPMFPMFWYYSRRLQFCLYRLVNIFDVCSYSLIFQISFFISSRTSPWGQQPASSQPVSRPWSRSIPRSIPRSMLRRISRGAGDGPRPIQDHCRPHSGNEFIDICCSLFICVEIFDDVCEQLLIFRCVQWYLSICLYLLISPDLYW